MRRCKVITLSREQAELMRARIENMSHPTLHEMCDSTKTVYQLKWLIGNYGEFRIERKK